METLNKQLLDTFIKRRKKLKKLIKLDGEIKRIFDKMLETQGEEN